MLESATARLHASHPGDAAHVHPTQRFAARRPNHAPKHVRSHKRRNLGRGVALAVTGVLAFAAAAIPTAAMQLQGNIASVATDYFLNTVQRPEPVVVGEPESPQALNILVLGTDGRNSAENVELGGYVEGVRSDTTIVMHISADRQHIAMVSIPRDSIVDIPACPTTTPGRYTTARPNTRFNAAFAFGFDAGRDIGSGAICTMHTIEQATNVRLDGFIAVDFNGFKNMVDALGGVEMNIPNAIYAPMADGLRLDPGYQTLDGWQALQFARARIGQGLGDGSDLRRIERQQDLLAAIALNVLSRNLLTDAPALLQFLGATTSSLTMSDNLSSLTGLNALAGSMQGISPDNIQFITIPNMLNPANPNTVVWLPEAEDVWNSLRYSDSLFSDSESDDVDDHVATDADADVDAENGGSAITDAAGVTG